MLVQPIRDAERINKIVFYTTRYWSDVRQHGAYSTVIEPGLIQNRQISLFGPLAIAAYKVISIHKILLGYDHIRTHIHLRMAETLLWFKHTRKREEENYAFTRAPFEKSKSIGKLFMIAHVDGSIYMREKCNNSKRNRHGKIIQQIHSGRFWSQTLRSLLWQ